MDKTPTQRLRECINRESGLIRITDLADYLLAERSSCGDSLFMDIPDTQANRIRGKAAFCSELHRILTGNPDE